MANFVHTGSVILIELLLLFFTLFWYLTSRWNFSAASTDTFRCHNNSAFSDLMCRDTCRERWYNGSCKIHAVWHGGCGGGRLLAKRTESQSQLVVLQSARSNVGKGREKSLTPVPLWQSHAVRDKQSSAQITKWPSLNLLPCISCK